MEESGRREARSCLPTTLAMLLGSDERPAVRLVCTAQRHTHFAASPFRRGRCPTPIPGQESPRPGLDGGQIHCYAQYQDGRSTRGRERSEGARHGSRAALSGAVRSRFGQPGEPRTVFAPAHAPRSGEARGLPSRRWAAEGAEQALCAAHQAPGHEQARRRARDASVRRRAPEPPAAEGAPGHRAGVSS